jgi:hypothetical protein
VASFWAKEWALLLTAVLVLVFDIFCCWLIYSAVDENTRRSGWGPIVGHASLTQHAVLGDSQSNGR